MIISFLISILITYGFVLIAVRGRIFEEVRTAIKTKLDKLEKYMYPSLDTISELLLQNSNEICTTQHELHARIIGKINNSNQSNLPELLDLLKDLKQKIQTNIIKKRNTLLNRLHKWALVKLDIFVNCPMCQGFWIGIALACILAYNPIFLFNQQIVIVNSLNPLGLFLWGCLTSGTTWAIDQFIEYFSNNQNS